MAAKHKNLFLYLTLACFVGLILVFIFDGYMGFHDSVLVTAREFSQKIEADQWSQEDRYGYLPSTNVEWGGKVDFSYEVDNRRFSSYTADIEVSVWHSQEKVSDLLVQTVALGSFDKEEVKWVVDTSALLPEDAPSEQGYQYTIIIKRGEIERKIVVDVSPTPYVPKPVIIEPTR